jgi:DNA-binding transcriptional ArsR family regulator
MLTKDEANLSKCEVDILHSDLVEKAQKDLLDGLAATRISKLFQAMADPTRIRLLSALFSTELCVCDLAALVGMTQSAISHQLRLLRDWHLVKARKDGRIVYYTLDDEHIHEFIQLAKEHTQHGHHGNN